MSGVALLTSAAGTGSAPVYSVGAGTSVVDVGAGSAQAAIVYQTDGDIISAAVNLGSADVGDWISPKAGAPGTYTMRASVFSGTTPNVGSALDSDLALTSERSWGLSQAGVGSVTCVLTITLKNAGGTTVASGNVTITATAV